MALFSVADIVTAIFLLVTVIDAAQRRDRRKSSNALVLTMIAAVVMVVLDSLSGFVYPDPTPAGLLYIAEVFSVIATKGILMFFYFYCYEYFRERTEISRRLFTVPMALLAVTIIVQAVSVFSDGYMTVSSGAVIVTGSIPGSTNSAMIVLSLYLPILAVIKRRNVGVSAVFFVGIFSIVPIVIAFLGFHDYTTCCGAFIVFITYVLLQNGIYNQREQEQRILEADKEQLESFNAQLEENQTRLEEAAAEQEAQIEEITALNSELEERQIRLEEAQAEQESQLAEITELNCRLESSRSELEQALLSSKESSEVLNRVHEVLGSAPWKIEYDETGKETKAEFSDGLRRLFGFENEKDYPNSLDFMISRVHPADKDRMLKEVYEVLGSNDKERIHVASQYRAYTKDRTLRWYRVQGIVKRREDGTPQLAYGVILDITNLEEAEIRQQELLEAFESIHDAIGSAYWQMSFDEQGSMTSCTWSDRFRKMIGYYGTEDFPDELSSWSDLLHPLDKKMTLNAYWAAVNDRTGKTIYSVEYRLLTRTRGYRWYSAHGSLSRYADGTPKIFYGIFLDVNDQVLSALNQEASINEITELNKQLEENQAELEASAAEQEAQIEEIAALNTQLQEKQARLQEASVQQELQLEETQTLNQELREAKEAAEAANAAKTSFLFNMSHDIRTPMNAIIGFRNLLEKHQEEPEKRQDYLNKIQDASTVLLSIINNVLEMARIEKGTLEIDETAWSTEQFNDTLYSVFRVMMEEKGLNFTRQIEVQHHYVYCDPTKLREIFINILSNAYKYTNAGGSVNMHLEEIPSDREGWVLYRTTISDTGIGMSEEFLPHIFEEFSREQNTTDAKVEGTGLGMPIVKRLVEMLDGRIEVKSRRGEGSTFIVTIPHRIADKTNLVEYAGVTIDPGLFRDKHILLAEDNDLNAEIAMEILSEAGFIVDRAEDGTVCVDMLEKAEAGHYDLILMDIQMPNMNGYEATRAIRQLEDQDKANIEIIAMTANAFEEDRREALKAGMNGHLAKPINVNELMQTLAMLVR